MIVASSEMDRSETGHSENDAIAIPRIDRLNSILISGDHSASVETVSDGHGQPENRYPGGGLGTVSCETGNSPDSSA